MANIKSQIKRNKQNEKARLRNKAVKSSLKTAIRKYHAAVEAGDVETADALCADASRKLDQAVEQGRHPRQPGRQPQVGDREASARAPAAA